MDESSDARSRRLSAQRQRRYRLRKKMSPAAGVPGAEVVPATGHGGGNGLPAHAQSPMFGYARDLALSGLEEARRYDEYVRGLSPQRALTPLKAGSSPPASEARLQRAEALRALTQLAATPVSAVRVLRDVTHSLDLAAEYQAATEGRPTRLATSYFDDDGRVVVGEPALMDPEDMEAGFDD